jgi:hypothetical protein
VAAGQSSADVEELADGLGVADSAASLTVLVASPAVLETVSVVFFTVSPTVLVALETVSSTVSDSLEPVDEESGFAEESGDALADGVADGDGLAEEPPESELPPPRMPPSVSPRVPSRPPLLLDADGVGVAVPAPEPDDESDEPEPESEPEPDVAVGWGVALSPEPESGEEVLPESPDCVSFESLAPALAEGDGVAVSPLLEADGEGDDEASLDASSAVTQSLYSSAVRLLAVGDGDGLLPLPAARASEDVKPMPISTAVGIATEAMAFPAGMWNLVNSGFLGAAWRGPVLARDPSTSVPRVTSSAGTVPPVRPVGRARS